MFTTYNLHNMNNNYLDNKYSGYLQLIIGPMFAGKTSNLLQLYKMYKLINKRICVINFIEDKRYDENKLCNHDKEMISCLNLKLICDLNDDDLLHNDIFLINEGQFFLDLKESVLNLVEKYNKIVYVCGLDSDFNREPFQNIVDLIPYADEIIKKYAICVYCKNGNKALFSHRITNEKDRKVIGSDNYIPLCRKCYIKSNSK